MHRFLSASADSSAHAMSRTPGRHALLTALLWALASTVQPIWAQGTAGQGSAVVKRDASPQSAFRDADRRMMADLVHANYAEIETGKLALEKSQNPQVKAFAQRMVDDHQKMLSELQQVAKNKGVALPEGTDVQHKALSTALRLLSGDTFDNQYITRVGVNDHERTVELLKKTQAEAQDGDLKALAQKTLPQVQDHLAMARKLEETRGKKSGAKP